LVDRNTIVGIDLLVVGFVVSGLGYTLAQSVPIAAFGFAVAIIGALLLLLVPEPVPRDAYRALLSDSIRNVEIILEESDLRERAYFLQLEDGETRALVPLSTLKTTAAGVGGGSMSSEALRELDRAPRRFVVDHHGLRGLMLIPPGAEIVKLAKVERGGDLEESLRSALIEFSDLAGSVVAVEEEGSNVARVQIARPKLASESPFFNNCLGSPVSCIACCVAAVVKGQPVRIVDEKYDPALVRLTLEMVP
jgi:hypothetical protein